jgi:hypothetical protein
MHSFLGHVLPAVLCLDHGDDLNSGDMITASGVQGALRRALRVLLPGRSRRRLRRLPTGADRCWAG